jgi:hypothetical protein
VVPGFSRRCSCPCRSDESPKSALAITAAEPKQAERKPRLTRVTWQPGGAPKQRRGRCRVASGTRQPRCMAQRTSVCATVRDRGGDDLAGVCNAACMFEQGSSKIEVPRHGTDPVVAIVPAQ